MAEEKPVVYLLHGEDELAITQFIAEVQNKLGDSSLVAMNLTTLDGRTFNLDELLSVAAAAPFLAERRIVVLTHFSAKLSQPAAQERFILTLERLPRTTALLLVEYETLDNNYLRSKNKVKVRRVFDWADSVGNSWVYMRNFALPRGGAMTRYIMDAARAAGGQFSHQAADLLTSLVGDNTRLAVNEVEKLLTYVNFHRPVEVDDVQLLTADSSEPDIFALVDAIGARDGRLALGTLHELLEVQDALSLLGMTARQFRLIMITREVLDAGGREAEIIKKARVHPFVAGKLIPQARNFDLPTLKAIYRRLLDMDEAHKTSGTPLDLALHTLIVSLSA
ncbi:MAG TPA: DNA polymerase III subunit delta [Anaerolineales bacterium]|nr:DNA polymerase III subunit delta [Anaerolineales bacterium]